MMPLRLLQKTFALALLDGARQVPAGIRSPHGSAVIRRFNLYRNNVFVSLAEALATRFPVCQALVGEEFFRAMARVFVELSPPRSPLLMTYGEDFGGFIDTFPPARSVPYLGDMARLEAALTRAYHAADAAPVSVEALAALAPGAWERTRVAFHPSVEIVRSPFPIVTIFEAHAHPNAEQAIDGSTAEDALVIRPDVEVEIHRLPPGRAIFMSSLLGGATFRDAADKAAAADPRFDLVTNLTGLLVSRIIVGLATSLSTRAVRN